MLWNFRDSRRFLRKLSSTMERGSSDNCANAEGIFGHVRHLNFLKLLDFSKAYTGLIVQDIFCWINYEVKISILAPVKPQERAQSFFPNAPLLNRANFSHSKKTAESFFRTLTGTRISKYVKKICFSFYYISISPYKNFFSS